MQLDPEWTEVRECPACGKRAFVIDPDNANLYDLWIEADGSTSAEPHAAHCPKAPVRRAGGHRV